MPLIWAAISAHGYGHAAQVVPVLNALGKLIPELHVLLRTTVPDSFFKDCLSIPWEISTVQQDIGCIQDGPLTIDNQATWLAHQQFHATWHERVHAEVDALRAIRPELVLADTPYLALAAAKRAGIPSVALISLTWDDVLAALPAPEEVDREALLRSIRLAYGQADRAIRLTPSPPIDVFPHPSDIGPITEPALPARAALARTLRLKRNEKTVLVGFGGIPLASVPFAELEHLHGFRFLFDGLVPAGRKQFVSTRSLPYSFKTLLASVDLIMTKPGYGTIVEAVALERPVVYVRRYNFADEQTLVDYLHRHGRGVELSQNDFLHGHWEKALHRVLGLPTPTTAPPPPTGATEAAALLASHLSPSKGHDRYPPR